MHAQIFNFTSLENFLLARAKELREGKKPTEYVDTTRSHTPDGDKDEQRGDDLIFQALIHNSRAEHEEAMTVAPGKSSKSALKGKEA